MSTLKRTNVQDHDNTGSKKQRIANGESVTAKTANLIHAIRELWDHSGADNNADNNDLEAYMGEEAYKHLSGLYHIFNKQAIASKTQPTKRDNIPEINHANSGQAITPFTITPWKSCEIPPKLPLLPKVLDPTLETAAFTHQGMTAGRVGDLNYERLEWVGDAYLQLTCTLLIAQTFPALTPGKCSQLRERCVKNLTLASYARQYGFDHRAQIPDELRNSKHPSKEHDMTKIMGDIFEAYVAAIILSDPMLGIKHVIDWLKKLWSVELKREIVEADKTGAKFDSPMWNLRGAVDHVEIRDSGPVDLGPKEVLQKLLASKGVKLTYKEAALEKKDKKNKLPLFTVGVYLNGYGKKDMQLGYGTGNGKKDAGMRAAEMALNNKKLMKELTEKKKIHDAHLEREREALDGVSGA